MLEASSSLWEEIKLGSISVSLCGLAAAGSILSLFPTVAVYTDKNGMKKRPRGAWSL